MTDWALRAIPWLWAGALAFFAVAIGGLTYAVAIGALVMTAGSLVTLPATSGNRYSLTLAVVASFPLLYRTGPNFTGAVDLRIALAATAGGLVLIWALNLMRGQADLDFFALLVRQTVGMASFLIIDAYVVSAIDTMPIFTPDGFGAKLTALALAGVGWFLIETFFWAYVTFARSQLHRRYLWVLALQDWPVASGLLATGALFGVAFPAIGFGAVAIAAIPYGFVHIAFHRYHETRRTYGQTIRALARIPEVASLSPEGHSDRSADLAVAVAQELGSSPAEVTELSYAALMHDIGRVTLNEPNIIRMGFTDEDIARWGAEIISEAPYLTDVAELVRQQHNPYRRPGEQKDESLRDGSKIIKVASAYDHATADLGMSPLEALEILHRGAAYDFDPDVVEATRRVLIRRRVVVS